MVGFVTAGVLTTLLVFLADATKASQRCHTGGSFSGYGSEVMRFPEQNLCVIVLANVNSIDASAKAKQIADIVLDLADDPPRNDAVERADQPNLGRHRHPMSVSSIKPIVGVC